MKTERKQNQVPTIMQTYYNIRIVSYLVLHDNFGFTGKKIINLEKVVDKYLTDYESGLLPTGFFVEQMNEKGIDVQAIVKDIPSRERMILAYGDKIPKRISPQDMSAIRVTMQTYLAIGLYAINKDMRISVKKIKEIYLPSLASCIECLADKKRLKLIDIIAIIAEECNYLDPRYEQKKID